MGNLILLTGASGFLGSALLKELICEQLSVSIVVRELLQAPPNVKQIQIEGINSQTDWSGLVTCHTVIHCAASAHNKGETLKSLREVNSCGSLNLANEAFKKGMRRFIFISSIGVNGSNSKKPFTENDIVSPCSDYAVSKYEAEEKLKTLSTKLGFELVIIRPPLVYGIGAPGNFNKLLGLTKKSLLLPFGLCKNKRSFISIDNLVAFIIVCISHPKAANEIFCVSDGVDVSIRDFTNSIAVGLDKKITQLPVPIALFKFFGKISGKTVLVEQLIGDLQIDSNKAKKLLDWTPSITMSDVFLNLKNIKNN